MITALLAGLGTGLALIVAIGAQNAFVLRQGLLRSHVLLVVAICALSDLVLITAGVAGMGTVVQHFPALLDAMRWCGAAFLAGYAVLAARRAVIGSRLETSERPRLSGRAALATGLAFTWLNPHVYLDTVLLLGSVASSHGPTGRWWFAAGAGTGSIVWFATLGFGSRVLAPVFARPLAWRVLDALIAVVMGTMAATLVLPR